MTKLSIIVPVYNVEKYIRPCFESIFKQGLDDMDFEVIIVNDGTKDKSMEMIADIISQHQNISVINQENQGLSVARNMGISAAKGEYIFMLDSDDLIIDNSIPFLLEHALSSKADLVVADFIKMSDEEVSHIQTDSIKQKEKIKLTEKIGERLLLEDLHPRQCYVWRTLFRRLFITDNNILFSPGILYQDVPFTHECYIKAKKCIRTNWLLNIYRIREESATYSFNIKKAKDFCIAISKTWELSHIEGLSLQVQRKLQDDVFTSISVMLWATSHAIKKASDREKIIDFLRQEVPDLNLRNGVKQRIATFMFKRMPHVLVFLRYYYDIILEDMVLPFYRHKIKKH